MMPEPNNMGLPLSKANLVTVTDKCPTSQQQRQIFNPQYGDILYGDQLATWWHTDYIEPFFPAGKVT